MELIQISKKYSLPMQALVGIMLVAQLFIVVILLYLGKNYNLVFHAAIEWYGWAMLAATVVFAVWNVVLLWGRNRKLKNATDEETKKQIFQSSLYGRYFTLVAIVLLGITITFISRNLFFMFYVVLSFAWQIALFPWKRDIEAVVNLGISNSKELQETKETATVEQTSEPTQEPKPENPSEK